MNALEIRVSYFANSYDTTGESIRSISGHMNTGTIGSLFNCIKNGGKNGNLSWQINEIRQTNDTSLRREKKRLLPVVMWQGIFRTRNNDDIVSLSSLICIDIDHKTSVEIEEIKRELKQWDFVVAFFNSPSGDGIKVVLLTDLTDITYYLNCYKQLEKLFEDKFSVFPDKNCEPLSQGCYLSYDPNIYVNPNALPWHFEHNPAFDEYGKSLSNGKSISNGYTTTPISHQAAFMNKLNCMGNFVTDDKVIEILDRKFSRFPQNYQDGYRTKSIFVQAAILCKAGIKQEDAIEYLKSKFLPTGFVENKLEYEADRSYKKYADLFGSERGTYQSYSSYSKSHKKRGT